MRSVGGLRRDGCSCRRCFGVPSPEPVAVVARLLVASPLEQNHLWELFARHTTMTLIVLYLVYSQVSTVVSAKKSNTTSFRMSGKRLRA